MINTIKKRLSSSQYSKNVSSSGLAEIGGRVFRLASTVVVAKYLNVTDYGLLAIVMTVYDFISVFNNSGIGLKLIQASDDELDDLVHTCYYINWIVSISLFILQTILAYPISLIFNSPSLTLPIIFMGTGYLISPMYTIQANLITRINKLGIIARIQLIQAFLGSGLTALLAYMGFGLWSVIIPFTGCTFIWWIICNQESSWRPTKPFTLHKWREIVSFSQSVLGANLLTKLRANLDYLLIGKFLSVEQLGIYYFAFNAGLGISITIGSTITNPIYPNICQVREDINLLKQRYNSGIKALLICFVPLVIIQSIAAPFYVPIVFGSKWVELGAVPILVLICLSALGRPFVDAAGHLLNAINKPDINLKFNVIFSIVFTLSLILTVGMGVLPVAIAVCVVHTIFLPIFFLYSYRLVFKGK